MKEYRIDVVAPDILFEGGVDLSCSQPNKHKQIQKKSVELGYPVIGERWDYNANTIILKKDFITFCYDEIKYENVCKISCEDFLNLTYDDVHTDAIPIVSKLDSRNRIELAEKILLAIIKADYNSDKDRLRRHIADAFRYTKIFEQNISYLDKHKK